MWNRADSQQWELVDAGSRNGTMVGQNDLVPHVPCALTPGARVHLGDIELIFLDPPAFVTYLENKIRPASTP